MPSMRPRRSGLAGLFVVVALIAAAIPGAVAGSWLTPVPSAPLPIDADPTALAASRVVIADRSVPEPLGAAAAAASEPIAASSVRRPTDRPQVSGWTGRGDTGAPSVKARSVSRVEAAAPCAKSMQVVHADGAGRVSTYAVRWWRVTTPDDGAWAYASQGSPSLTLQTCVGANSQYRLIVRLTKVG